MVAAIITIGSRVVLRSVGPEIGSHKVSVIKDSTSFCDIEPPSPHDTNFYMGSLVLTAQRVQLQLLSIPLSPAANVSVKSTTTSLTS